MGKVAVDAIYLRVKNGSGVKEFGADSEPLKPLSSAYIKQRAKNPNLSSDTSPGFSNLTLTGQMLESLTFKTNARDGTMQVLIKNAEALKKAMYTNATRPWINLSSYEIRLLRDTLSQLLKGKL